MCDQVRIFFLLRMNASVCIYFRYKFVPYSSLTGFIPLGMMSFAVLALFLFSTCSCHPLGTVIQEEGEFFPLAGYHHVILHMDFSSFNSTLHTLESEHPEASFSNLILIWNQLKSLLPSFHSRTKRGAFNFIGDLSNSLFGTATQAQVSSLHKSLHSIFSDEESLRMSFNNQSLAFSHLQNSAITDHKNLIELQQDLANITTLFQSQLLTTHKYFALSKLRLAMQLLYQRLSATLHSVSSLVLEKCPLIVFGHSFPDLVAIAKLNLTDSNVFPTSLTSLYSWSHCSLTTIDHLTLSVIVSLPLITPVRYTHFIAHPFPARFHLSMENYFILSMKHSSLYFSNANQSLFLPQDSNCHSSICQTTLIHYDFSDFCLPAILLSLPSPADCHITLFSPPVFTFAPVNHSTLAIFSPYRTILTFHCPFQNRMNLTLLHVVFVSIENCSMFFNNSLAKLPMTNSTIYLPTHEFLSVLEFKKVSLFLNSLDSNFTNFNYSHQVKTDFPTFNFSSLIHLNPFTDPDSLTVSTSLLNFPHFWWFSGMTVLCLVCIFCGVFISCKFSHGRLNVCTRVDNSPPPVVSEQPVSIVIPPISGSSPSPPVSTPIVNSDVPSPPVITYIQSVPHAYHSQPAFHPPRFVTLR